MVEPNICRFSKSRVILKLCRLCSWRDNVCSVRGMKHSLIRNGQQHMKGKKLLSGW